MDETTARAKLEDMVAASVFPQLAPEKIDRLLEEYRRTDSNDISPDDEVEWAGETIHELGDVVVPTDRPGTAWRVTLAGTTAATEPVWPAAGTIVDGTVTWSLADDIAVWDGTWDLNRAAAEGWRIKAGLVSNRHSFGSNQGNYNPEQLFEHCMRMAEHYGNKSFGSILLRSGRWSGTGRLNAAHYEDAV